MKINSTIRIIGERVVLVPYKKMHVEKYHRWMLSPELQELTASEPLSLKEEYEMQQSWLIDDDKCTFIVLDKCLLAEKNNELEAMIGDTNLFLVDQEDRTRAEGEIMIAEPLFRGQKRGWEAMLLMFRYGIEQLGVKTYEVKIGMSNTPSIKMFQKMHFEETTRSDVFQEVTLECSVNEKWKEWLNENIKHFEIVPDEMLN
ncbi:alpha/beta-tubulin-N-acetyltransferase 9 [Penaeus vannamei]|uniref:alpha/beta-tubulin-N-acetyltransferase 9 n=1 Tax=Penaeus vannamei TaxID=6689 RepID=UPI000F65ED2A|nr:N-acetyltransferase 9-like [Penaeus vannamei]XP_027215005.1 N-acetyltransferase 9-like [Penaeus vannamei]XP_027215011.1 N-acetyltransferase 9-like [Penaeus vannamei]XP_027215018.1 N-acetyltransferase 9-like [Penaeus vannamei]XP_027215026.1 N-acetyltransferase 9-like [Penaeus vannamei]XP_027215033.1 N-acetyltransferase 9-like [Penaeus vannamei]